MLSCRSCFVILLAIAQLIVACEEDAQGPDGSCTPDAAAWEQEVQPIVSRYCGSCHGVEPDFGAPISLTELMPMLMGAHGERTVDHMVSLLMDGRMPPVGMPRLPDADLATIVEWASCGEQTPRPGVGLISSAPVFLAPDEAPAGLDHVDFLAPDFAVEEDVRDLYQCWTFEAPVTEAALIRRFEMVIDESRVLHHVVLLRDEDGTAPDEPHTCLSMPEGSHYLYAWAPGQGAFEFPDGGLRMEPGDRYVMQIHYNNSAEVPEVSDSSGVRLYYGPVEGAEYGMYAIGPLGFSIPARSTASAQSSCTATERMTVLAGLPHMHEVGSSFEQSVERADGSMEPFFSLTGWSFETQLFYQMPLTLEPGDRLITRCTWDNPRGEAVSSGPRTQDEMCFNFMYVTPPPPARYCDEEDGGVPTDVTYAPGECAPPELPDETTLAMGRFEVGEAPTLAGGAPVDGVYRLSDLAFWMASPDLPVGRLDQERSGLLGRGWLIIEEGAVTLDLDAQTYLISDSGFEISRENEISFSGAWSPGMSPAEVQSDCPGMGMQTVAYEVTDEVITLGFEVTVAGVPIFPRYSFARVELSGDP